jgi:hypothetical protein
MEVKVSDIEGDTMPINIRSLDDVGLFLSLSLKEAEELNDKLGFAIQDYRMRMEEGKDG